MNRNLNVVPFISVDSMMRLVNTIGIERFITELAAYIEEDFRRWDLFDKSPRVASHSTDGVIELMPTSDGRLYGFKYVNGHPRNTIDGRQTVTAFGVLADVGNGYPMLLSEMTILTALRTAATSAVAAKYLAPGNASTMALIGNGAQSEFQAVAFKTLLGVETLRLYDIDASASERLARNLADMGFDITICASSQEAVEGAQIITTATADKQYATILTDNMVGEGSPHQCRRRRLSGKDGTASRHPAASGYLRRISATDADRRGNSAVGCRSSGHRTLDGDGRQGKRPFGCEADDAVRLGRLRHRGFFGAEICPRPDRHYGSL